MKNKVKRLAAFLMALSVTATGLVQSMSTTVLADETDSVTSVITEELTASEESETEPTPEVTAEPTLAPTAEPTVEPTAEPEITPEPSETPAATEEPTAEPSEAPSTEPSASASPSALPTADIDDEIATYAAANGDYTIGEWTYTVADGKAYIKKYIGYRSSVTIPTSVVISGTTYKIRTIGEYAFENNDDVRYVTIPSTITSISKCAFKNCTNLSSITINGNIADCESNSTSSGDYSWSSAKNSVFYNAGTNADGMTVTFGAGVTRVPAYLFATGYDRGEDVYAHVKKVIFSSTVTDIGKCAFYRCYDLTTLDLSKASKLSNIGDDAFDLCSSLQQIDFTGAAGLKTISAYAFASTGLKSVTFPKNLTTIGEYAFDSCMDLTKIVLPKSVTKVNKCAFRNCTGLSSITINGNIADCESNSTSSGDYSWSSAKNSVFYNAGTNTDGMTVTFGVGVTRVPAYLFATGYDVGDNVYANVKKITLSSTVKQIGNCAFYNCFGLKTLNINGNLNDLSQDSQAFYAAGKQSGGISVTFSTNAKRIPAYLFATGASRASRDYAHVKSVYIPYTVKTIGKYAFSRCFALKMLDFHGDRVTFGTNALQYVNAKAYYQSGSKSWIASYRKNYANSKLTWVARTAYLGTVQLTGITAKSNGITVRWNKVSKAEKYNVYRRTANGNWTLIARISATQYNDTTAKKGTTYYYTVRAVSGGNISPSYNTTGLKCTRT